MRPEYQRGQIYPLIAFTLVAMVALSAMAVDMGYYRYSQRAQQTATDSAAIAAVTQAVNPSPNAANAAYADAKQNGFATSDPNITVAAVPTSDVYTGGFTAYKVTITKKYPRLFGAYFNKNKQGIVTTAVGALKNIPDTCILTTGTAAGSLNLQGDTLNGPNCGVVSNGCPTDTKATIDVANFTEPTGCANSGSYTGATPTKVGAPAPDPCLYISGCNYLNQSYTANTSGCATYKAASGETTAILTGGCYSSVTFNLGESVILEPSGPPYIVIVNGVWNLNKPSSVTSGPNGVTLFATSGSSISMSGVTTVTLSAPTTGSTDGILYYQIGTGTVNFNNSNTAATWTLDGIMYAPNATNMNLNGNINFGATTLMIAPTINLNCPGGKGPCQTKLSPSGSNTAGNTAPTLTE